MSKTLVVIPTYDEADNIAALLRELFGLGVPGLEILVVDDASPDGTFDIVKGLQRGNPALHLLRRLGPRGRGLAGRDGLIMALRLGADIVVEMDGDFSHQPRFVPELLKAMERCDVAVGSRLTAGGSDRDRPLWRRLLTKAANLYAGAALGLGVRDANSGFRCFSREALLAIDPASLKSRGPSIVHEILHRAARAGLRFAEVPIEFIDRRHGASKLTLGRLAAGYAWIARLRLSR